MPALRSTFASLLHVLDEAILGRLLDRFSRIRLRDGEVARMVVSSHSIEFSVESPRRARLVADAESRYDPGEIQWLEEESRASSPQPSPVPSVSPSPEYPPFGPRPFIDPGPRGSTRAYFYSSEEIERRYEGTLSFPIELMSLVGSELGSTRLQSSLLTPAQCLFSAGTFQGCTTTGKSAAAVTLRT
jgi:hypothetical protein